MNVHTTEHRRRAVAALVAVGALLVDAGESAACACCNSITTRDAIGWASDGATLLVRNDTVAGCARSVRYEVFHPTKSAPVACYDLMTDPTVRLPCEAVTPPADGRWDPVASTVPVGFSGAVFSFDSPGLRVEYAPAPEGPGRLVVTLRARGGRHVLFDEPKWPHGSMGGDESQAIVASVVQAPTERLGALVLEEWAEPRADGDLDYEGSSLTWVRLPEGTPEAKRGFHRVAAVTVPKIVVEPLEDEVAPEPDAPEQELVVIPGGPPAQRRGCVCSAAGAGSQDPTWLALGLAVLLWRRSTGREVDRARGAALVERPELVGDVGGIERGLTAVEGCAFDHAEHDHLADVDVFG